MKTNSKSDWRLSLEDGAKKIGAEILLSENVMVDYTKTYSEIILKARGIEKEQMNPSEHRALIIANKCEPSKHETIKETVVLFRYSDWMKMSDEDYSQAIEWGLSNNLYKTTLHVPLAVIEQNPHLFDKTCMRFVVATAICDNGYFACYRNRDFLRDPCGAGIYCQYESGLMEAWFSFVK